MSNVAIKWTGEGSRMFVGRDSRGQVVVAGTWPSEDPSWQEWKALKPSDLLLLGLASCTAYDIVTILERQRQRLLRLSLEVNGDQSTDPPRAFTGIHIHYLLAGDSLDPKKVERAIILSQEQYCSVAATVRGVSKVTYSFEIES
jgi:putative redox protein